MKKVKKRSDTLSRKPKALSLKEINRITHDFWRKGGLLAGGGTMEPEAERKYGDEEEELEEWEGMERRWEANEGDEEPGEAP